MIRKRIERPKMVGRRILIEVDLGQRGVERTDVTVFVNGESIENHWDYCFSSLPHLVKELKANYPDAEIETWCSGEDCAGRSHRWKIAI